MTPQKLIDNFSTHLKNVLARAISFAGSIGQKNVEPIHLLLAITEEAGSVGAEITKKAGLTSEKIHQECTVGIPTKHLPDLGTEARKILEKALNLAYDREHNYIGTEHLLFGILAINNRDIERVFKACNTDRAQLKKYTETVLNTAGHFATMEDIVETFDEMNNLPEITANTTGQPPQPGMPHQHEQPAQPGNNKKAKPMSALEYFTVNLTSPTVEKKLDPVIGREQEINRLMHILARRTKNNPLLIGEPGVGKTAIVEGLAKRIMAGDVPETLLRKKILSLDLTLLISGTIYRGEFEARLKQVIDEVAAHPNYILFIDEIHNIIGAGSNQGTLDAANILKPALARGEIRCIGATTLDEFKKHISSDPALERRFQPIIVEEPLRADTIRILEGLRQYYETHHEVTFTKEAIVAAVDLSNRYVHDQYQPDKAIDLLDESAATVRVHQKATASAQVLRRLERKIERLESAKNKAISEERLEDALKLRKEIKKITSQFKKQTTLVERQKKNAKRPIITEAEILTTLAAKLNLNPTDVTTDEWSRLDTITSELQKNIIGQSTALDSIMHTLERAFLGLSRPHHPRAALLFAGPSGVGKTETARQLAKILYHSEKALIRLDMSEFTESHSVARLLGSPAGYVGYKERNRFTDELRKRPHSILLFDEFDKAHADVRKLLLQILDEGELTDSTGKKIHFDQTIVILTTNIGASVFKNTTFGFGHSDNVQTEQKNRVLQQLRDELTPALISRLDTVCIFQPLSQSAIGTIITTHLQELCARLATERKITITADETALKTLSTEAYNPDLGARAIAQTIDRLLPDLVIDALKQQKNKKRFVLIHDQKSFSLRAT